MALKVRDRVKETTTTTGTGTITLGGAVTGFRTFSSVLSDNDTTYYAIVGDTQFEVGLGTYSSNTLARTTVLSSSNSNSAVSFSTGTKNVFITQPSGKAVFRDASGNIAELTTANLSENTNLYYTDERVDDRISALFQSGTGISFAYNDSSNTFTPTVTLSPFSTSNLSEGSNLYYTDNRFDTRLAAKDTDNLSEGSSNLYFTNERVDDRVASLLQNGTGISFTYNDSSNTLTPVISLSSFDTDNLSEGSSNLYHTTERVQDIVGAMFSSNTETGITVSYEDSDGTIDLVVATQSDNNFTTTLLNKLNAIESNATADQTASEIRTLVESASDSNVFTDADHSKLDGIEASATADQTASEIKTAYENNSDTNAFTDTLLSKLNGIESGATADQSSEEIQDIVGAMFSSNTETGITATYQDADGTIDLVIGTLNQDTTGNSATATALETARTINGVSFNGTANISFTTDAVSEGSSNLYYTDTRVNSFLTTNSYATQSFVNTAVSNLVDSAPSTLDTLNELAAALGDDANFSTTTATSLGNRLRIDVSNQGLTSTQKTNALTNLGINSEYSGNSATATALATARTIHGVSFDGTANIDLSEVIQDTVGAMFSSNTETGITATYEDGDGTIDLVVATQTANDFTTTLKNKLDGIEASATADQSDSEIKTAYENNSDTNAFTDALLSKLNGIEANATADQTAEEIQDIVGAMFSSNTETGITATYQDADGTIDLVVTGSTPTSIADADGDTKIQVEESSDEDKIRFDTGGIERVIINSVGVGIGENSPSKKLVLNENDSECVMIIKSSDTGTAGIYLGDQSDEIVGGLIYDNANDLLQLRSSNNNTAVSINSSEDVGIGTTSPSAALHVKSNGGIARLESTSATGNNYLSFYDSSALKGHVGYTGSSDDDFNIFQNESANIKLFTAGSERMRIDSSGNVLIGETSAITNNKLVAKLADSGVTATSNQSVAFFENNTNAWLTIGSGTSSYGGILFGDSGDNDIGQVRYNHNGNEMEFVTNTAVAMTIDSSGNVGIGTSSPDDLLTISKNASSDSPSLIVRRSTDTSSSGDFVQGIKFANGTLSQRAEIQAVQGSQYADNIALNFVTMAGLGNRGTRMHIGGTGEVGIGTDNPVSVGGHDGVLTLFGSNATALVLKNNTSTSRLAQLGSDLAFFVDTYETERLRIKSGGAVLIGTTDLSSGTGIQLKNEEFHVNIANGSSLFRNVRSDTAGNALTLDRNTGDGDLLDLKKADSSQGAIGVIGNDIFINSTDEGRLHVGGTGRYSWSDTLFGPQNDNARDLGSSSARWQDVYATNGTIQTSDRNEKQDIAEISEAEARVAVAVKGLLRKFKWKDAVAEKGVEARIHFGIIAQDLQDAFTAEGLDAGDYGMFISSTWTDDDGVEQTRLGVRYSELIAFIIAGI